MTNTNDDTDEDVAAAEAESFSLDYWKLKYESLSAEFDEYRQINEEMENEYELQLRQNEDKIRDLELKHSRCTHENDSLKRKLNELSTQTHTQISMLQQELSKFKSVKDEMQKYIRELEQKNDDLERTSRCAMFSLNEFEQKLNEALERNAILESELDEKEQLVVDVQRLRDESRDLRQELAARQKKEFQKPHTPQLLTPSTPKVNECLNTISSIELHQPLPLQTHKDNQPISSTKEIKRISCLNYVNDLLRKITSLENRLNAKSSKENRDKTSILSIDNKNGSRNH